MLKKEQKQTDLIENKSPQLEKRVIEITAWANNCGASCIADFLTEQLLKNNLPDTSITKLCDIMISYYESPHCNKESLIILLSKSYPHPADQQIILGLALKSFLEHHSGQEIDAKGKGKGMVSEKALLSIAKELEFNVEFYIYANNKAGKKQLQKTNLLEEINDPRFSEKMPSLKAIYTGNHYNRIAETEQDAANYFTKCFELGKLPLDNITEMKATDRIKKNIANEFEKIIRTEQDKQLKEKEKKETETKDDTLSMILQAQEDVKNLIVLIEKNRLSITKTEPRKSLEKTLKHLQELDQKFPKTAEEINNDFIELLQNGLSQLDEFDKRLSGQESYASTLLLGKKDPLREKMSPLLTHLKTFCTNYTTKKNNPSA